jgi:hypothetical protein
VVICDRKSTKNGFVGLFYGLCRPGHDDYAAGQLPVLQEAGNQVSKLPKK